MYNKSIDILVFGEHELTIPQYTVNYDNSGHYYHNVI